MGRDGLAYLKVVIFGMRGGNNISDYDMVVGHQLANVRQQVNVIESGGTR